MTFPAHWRKAGPPLGCRPRRLIGNVSFSLGLFTETGLRHLTKFARVAPCPVFESHNLEPISVRRTSVHAGVEKEPGNGENGAADFHERGRESPWRAWAAGTARAGKR